MALVRAATRGVRLLWAADELLHWASQLRATRAVADLPRLREQLMGALREFQSRARHEGNEPARVAQATSVLAALLDQVVLTMPWGVQTGWQPLGASPSAAPGRRPAERLLAVCRGAGADPGMAELLAVALALGFDARTPGADAALLDAARAHLAQSLPAAPSHGSGLSAQWRSAVARRPALSGWLPLWVSGVAAAAVLAVLFAGLRLSLGTTSDRLYARLVALQMPAAAAPPPLPATQPRLASALAGLVTAGQLTVRDDIDRSVVVVSDAALFADSGNAALAPSAAAVLRPLAEALQREPGHIEVLGHTDGTLVPSARYPSEWELSVDRARAVQDALRALGIAATRLAHDGRANVEPTVQAAGGNGRIEIVLLAGR